MVLNVKLLEKTGNGCIIGFFNEWILNLCVKKTEF